MAIEQFNKGEVLTAAKMNTIRAAVNQAQTDITTLQTNSATKTELTAATTGTFYGYVATVDNLPSSGSNGYAYVGTAAPYAIYNRIDGNWTNSGSTLNNPVIAAVQDSSNLIHLSANGTEVTSNIATPEFIDDRLTDLETELSGLIFDVSEANGGQPFATLSDALTYADSVLLTSQKKGGMTIKYVQTSDNKYVQARCMAQNFTTDVTQWQVVTNEIKAGSKNLVESGAVASAIKEIDDIIYNKITSNVVLVNEGGYYKYSDGTFASNNSRQLTVIPVVAGDEYKITTELSSTAIAGIIYTSDETVTIGTALQNVLGYELKGNGTAEEIENYVPTIPSGTKYMIVQSAYNNPGSYYVSKKSYQGKSFYTKDETYSKTEIDDTISGINTDIDELSNNIDDISELVEEEVEEVVVVPVTIHTEGGSNGRWKGSDGTWVNDNARRSTDKISVVPGEKYLVTVNIGTSTGLAYLGQWDGTTYKGVATGFEAGSGNAVDRPYTVPEGVNMIAMSSYNTTNPSLKKVITAKEATFYTKQESDAKYATKEGVEDRKKYGVKWSNADASDLGERILDAVGLTATISVGNTAGSSNFDTIYPWSEMKRCNIKTNVNGAKIITFEGETGFALDGSNGDVFVRIPKFCAERYTKDGYEYRIVSKDGANIHPAFIEDGNVLDEIFIGAFEGTLDTNSKIRSIAGKIPTGNMTPSELLAASVGNGNEYTLYDMRCVDALFTLMAVEFGCRNSNQILGYGVADLDNPIPSRKIATYTGNSISITADSETTRKRQLIRYAVGQTITICGSDQMDIVAQRVVTSVTDPNNYEQLLVIGFDGPALELSTDMFYGNGPDLTNYIETVDSAYRINGHTGRSAKPTTIGGNSTGIKENQYNPCRYRWIENPIGNIWHILPDVSFNNLQMYVCKSMKDYVMYKVVAPYIPQGNLFPLQDSNNGNHFINQLSDMYFAKDIPFAVGSGDSNDETQGFGGYYYLNSGNVVIANGGGFDHVRRCNVLTHRAWIGSTEKWYLYGCRLIFKNLT